MAFSYTGGAENGGTGTSATVTHGLSINSGDLVVCYININDASTSITPTETWDGSNVETPTSETAQQGMYWQVAGSSEPSTFTFTLGTSTSWRLIIKVFTSASDAEVDSAFATSKTGSNTFDLVCDSISGATLSDNCLSVIAGGKDNRRATEIYTTADNSFVSVVGRTDDQCCAMAHRIWGTSPSAPASVIIDVTDGNDGLNDKTYSTHISFVESGGGPAPSVNLLTLLGVG